MSGELKVSGDGMSFTLSHSITGNGKPACPGKGGDFNGKPVPSSLAGSGTFKLSLEQTILGAVARLTLYSDIGLGETVVYEYQGEGSTNMPGDYSGEWSG